MTIPHYDHHNPTQGEPVSTEHFITKAAPIAEIAAVTKRKAADIEAEAISLGFYIGVDWAGRPAISTSEARSIVTGDARRDREHDAAFAAHIAACAAWTRGRDKAVRDAHADHLAAPRKGRTASDPIVQGNAKEAARDAGRAYELDTPIPLFDGMDTGNASRVYVDTQRGLIRRAAAKVLSSVPA
jgi:hypothetical protein